MHPKLISAAAVARKYELLLWEHQVRHEKKTMAKELNYWEILKFVSTHSSLALRASKEIDRALGVK